MPLEKMFDKNDVPAKPTVEPEITNVIQYNLGTENNPQMINLSKLILEEKV